MGNAKLYVYRVGHGLCTLLHAEKADGTPYNAVFDCGSLPLTGSNDCNGYSLPLKESIAHIADIIREGGNDHLDLLVSSHQDVDHNNMFIDLINTLNGWDQKTDDWIDCGDNGLFKTGECAWKKIRSRSQNEAEYEYKCDGNVSVNFKQFISGGGSSYFKIVENFTARKVFQLELNADGEHESPENNITFGIDFGFVINELKDGWSWQNIVTQFTNINISLDGNRLHLRHEIPGNLCCMDLNLFCSELVKMVSESIEGELEQEYVDWVNRLSVNVIKNENVFYTGKKIAEIVQGRHIPRPRFKLYSVVMGGYSDNKHYRALINTLRVYQSTFSGASDYPQMTLSVYPTYTYMQCEINAAPVIHTAENTVYSNEVDAVAVINASDMSAIKYNATSTVVNFVYKRDASGAYSVLFPGDITAHHHNDIAERIRASGLKVTHIIAPHHGSFDTNILINPANFAQFEDQYQPLYSLYASLPGATTIISECYKNAPHHLPRGEFIRIAVKSAPKYNLHRMSWFYADSDGSFKREEDVEWVNGVFTTGEYPTPKNEITVFDLEDRGVYWPDFVRDGSAANADISEHADMPNPVLPPANLFV